MKFAGSISARLVTLGCATVLAFALGDAQASTNSVSASQKAASPHSTTAKKARKKSRTTASSRRRGQQKIDKQRATAIQQALVREHYLDGSPSGVWDDKTQSALKRYQADNGWQSKTVPDSRALIKLGLGPDHQHLLNPESAMTAAPLPADNNQKSIPSSGTIPSSSSEVPKIPNNLRK